MKEELKDRFDEFKSEPSSPELDWKAIGPKIRSGIAKKNDRKRRGAFWLYFGLGFLLVIVISNVLFQKYTTKDDRHAEQFQTLQLEKESVDLLLDTNKDKVSLRPENDLSKDEVNTALIKETNTENALRSNQSLGFNTLNTLSKKEGTLDFTKKKLGEIIQTIPIAISSEPTAGQIKNTNTTTLQSEEGIDVVSERIKIARVELLPLKSFFVLKAEKVQHQLKSEMYVSSIEAIKDQSIPKRTWTIDVNIGTNSSSLMDEFLNSSSKLGNHLSSHLEYHTDNGFVFGTGIQLENIRFQSSAQWQDTIMLYRPNTIDTIYRFNNDFEFYAYKDSIMGIQSTDFGHTNQLKAYSIPLFVGYDWSYHKFLIGARLGVNFQFREQLVGRLVKEENQIIDIDETFSSTSMDYYLRLQFGYRFNNRLSIWTHIRSNRISGFEHPIDQDQVDARSIVSGSVGLRMAF